ncbi:hypothetical protein EDM57_03250 [Brevibacillus gelatini]|uniref:Uncharacterized protein n=1 Tax=Brevibacillus gelatini TaxID=1655277 RepID=A0A3M8B9E6_9BACL|nr:hypothetical protein EDM57_03250 [Brevibacillus gelatini]
MKHLLKIGRCTGEQGKHLFFLFCRSTRQASMRTASGCHKLKRRAGLFARSALHYDARREERKAMGCRRGFGFGGGGFLWIILIILLVTSFWDD